MTTALQILLGAAFAAYLILFVYLLAAPLMDDWRHRRRLRRK